MFCSQARRRADHLFRELWANDDDAQHKFAQRVLSGRYQFFEVDVVDPAGGERAVPDPRALASPRA